MDIKKTDVFSGIGVFTIQMIANGIWYAFQKNKIFLTIGIIFAVIISIFIVIIIGLKKLLILVVHLFLFSDYQFLNFQSVYRNTLLEPLVFFLDQ